MKKSKIYVFICLFTLIYIIFSKCIYDNNVVAKYTTKDLKALNSNGIEFSEINLKIVGLGAYIDFLENKDKVNYIYIKTNAMDNEVVSAKIYCDDKKDNLGKGKALSLDIKKGTQYIKIEPKKFVRIVFADNNWGSEIKFEYFKMNKNVDVIIPLVLGYIIIIIALGIVYLSLIKNDKYHLFNTIFVMFLILPSIIFIPLKPFLTGKNNENRNMSTYPELKIENLDKFPAEFEAYINDNLAFRQQLIEFNSDFKYKVLKTVNSDKVIKGKDDWLFYKETLADYEGTNLYNQKDLEKMAEQLNTVNEGLKKQNTDFVFMVFPNKNSVYPEAMEDYYKEADKKRMDYVYEFVDKKYPEIKKCYPVEALKKAKQNGDVYLHGDTHCCNYGAYVAANELYKAIGIEDNEIPKPVACEYSSTDLRAMLNLSDLSETSLKIEDKSFVTKSSKYKNVLCICDSFGPRLENSFNQKFENVTYVKWDSIGEKPLDAKGYDLVICESVERYIYRYLYLNKFLKTDINN